MNNKIYVDYETIKFGESLNNKYNKIKNLIKKLENSNDFKKDDVYESLLIDETIYENHIKKLKYLIDNGLLLGDDEDDEETITRIHNEWLMYEKNKRL
jgi:hypothetical protein